jgi:hypothetical protein
VYVIHPEYDAANQPIPGIPKLLVENVECRIGPLILIRPTDAEVRDQKITENYAHREVKINKYIPEILPSVTEITVWTPPNQRTETWHIVGVEEDGNKFSTRVRVEVIKP